VTDVLLAAGRRLCWAILVLLHRAGLARAINRLANRLERSDAAPYVRRRRCGTVQILVYHRVAPGTDSFLPSIPVATFTSHMECLARWFHVLDLSEAVDAMRSGSVPQNAVVVTFDDGYRDNFEYVYPILSALSLPATIFLTTSVIGTPGILWHDRVFRMFGETSASHLEGFGPGKQALSLGSPALRRTAREHALAELMRLDRRARNERLAELESQLDGTRTTPAERLMLSWEEVQKMHGKGVSFGAHTVTHQVLSGIPADERKWEILESKKEIERRLGTKVTTFAYPRGRCGDFDELTKSLLREAGVDCAVTTIPGGNSLDRGSWDPLELRRGGPNDPDRVVFLSKMNVYRFLG